MAYGDNRHSDKVSLMIDLRKVEHSATTTVFYPSHKLEVYQIHLSSSTITYFEELLGEQTKIKTCSLSSSTVASIMMYVAVNVTHWAGSSLMLFAHKFQ